MLRLRTAYVVIYKDEVIDDKTGRLTAFWFQSPDFLIREKADEFLKAALKNPGINIENRRKWSGPVDETYTVQLLEVVYDQYHRTIEQIKVPDTFDSTAA